MRRIFFLLPIVFSLQHFKAQTLYLAKDTIRSSFRLDISPFQFGYGYWGANTKTDMPESSSFLLTNTTKGFGGFHMDLQAIFKDKIGIETGFDFVSGNINQNKIRNEFQNHIPDYQVSFAPNNNHTGESPFTDGYEFRIFKAGLVGFIPYKKVVILPYADFLYTIESYYPSINVDFTDQTNSSSFKREYKFYNTNSNGFKAGTSLRWFFRNQNSKIKHARLYMQLRAEFVYLKTKGYGYYIDKDTNNNEVKSTSRNFSQDVYAFVLGFTLGGLDLHW